MSLLIGSCFWINDDRDGFYASAVKELVQRERPALQDPDGRPALRRRLGAAADKSVPQGLAAKYERYWGDDAYREMLAACPTLVSCDDHEFWNDFPQPQIQVPLSWDRYQPTNGNALAELYDAYQSCAEPGRQALVLDRHRRRSRSSSPTRARTARATTTRTRA